MINKEIYFNEFIKFWLPNYKRQYFKMKMKNDIKGIIEMKDNIYKNWNLNKEQKLKIIKEIGIKE